MTLFHGNRAYDPALDVRDCSALAQRVQQPPPDGVLWLLVAPRRGRKTWTLKALEKKLRGHRARYVDLRSATLPAKTPMKGYYFLVDEPLAQLQDPAAARALVETCAALHGQEARVVFAVTPAECEQLLEVGRERGLVSHKAVEAIRPLSPAEAKTLASRSAAATALLEELPAPWKRSAFLLELLFQVQEDPQNRGVLTDVRQLLRALLRECRGGATEYFSYVFLKGLSATQRKLLRRVARGEIRDATECDPLRYPFLVEQDPHTCLQRIADPVLEAYFAPLRVHHVSDVHVGPKAAQGMDAKISGPLALAADPGTVREGYLQHLQQLQAEGRAPHLLVISGDLTEHAADEQLRDAQAWIERARTLLADDPQLDEKERVLLVGGNHDVRWSEALRRDPQARHHPFGAIFADYHHPRLEQKPELRSVARAGYPDFGVEFLLLGSAELGGEYDAEQSLRDDPGLVHQDALNRVAAHRWAEQVRIAVLHHPVSPLPTVLELARYAGLINAGALKDRLLSCGFHLVLHGHAHSGCFAVEQWPDRHGGRTLRIAAAPSLSSREVQEPHGFNTIEIARDYDDQGKIQHRVTVRRVLRRGVQSWQEDAVLPTFTVA